MTGTDGAQLPHVVVLGGGPAGCGAAYQLRRTGKATVTLLAALLSGDWETAVASHDKQRREAAGLTAAFVQYHLERGLRSLRLVDRVTPSDQAQ